MRRFAVLPLPAQQSPDGRVRQSVECAAFVQSVERQYADEFAVDVQAASETGMYPLLAFSIDHQSGHQTGRVGTVSGKRTGSVSMISRGLVPPGRNGVHQVGRKPMTGHGDSIRPASGGVKQHRKETRTDGRDQALKLDFARHGVRSRRRFTRRARSMAFGKAWFA